MPHRALVLSISLTLAMACASTAPPTVDLETQLELWRTELEEVDQLLAQGEWGRAHGSSERLLVEMADRLLGGEGSGLWLARAVTRRSLAEAGLGNAEDARWDRGIVAILHPQAWTEPDLSAYPADVLAVVPAEAPSPPPVATEGFPGPPGQASAPSEITPPRKIRGSAARYPTGKRHAGARDVLKARTVIGTDGRVRNPTPVDPNADPVLLFATLDALRDWRFEPARKDGEPVETHFQLTMNFR